VKPHYSVDERAIELAKIHQAIRDYRTALDNREHGVVAAHQALDAIQEAIGLEPWRPQADGAPPEPPTSDNGEATWHDHKG
jgi:hypothetical protein